MVPIKYYIQGWFDGTYFQETIQEVIPGNRSSGLKKIKHTLYRGIIQEPSLISEDEFYSSEYELLFKQVNNIQINSNPGQWPEPNTRIFSLGEIRFTSIQGNNLHHLNQVGYYKISGHITATVVTESYSIDSKGGEKIGVSDKKQGGSPVGQVNALFKKIFTFR